MQESIEALPHDALWVMSKYRNELCVMSCEFLTDKDYSSRIANLLITHRRLDITNQSRRRKKCLQI